MSIRVWCLWLLLAVSVRAATPAVTWFPDNDSFRSWTEPGIFKLRPISPAEYQASHVQSWELALYRTSNPQDKLRLPCPPPAIQSENGWAAWDETAFHDLPATLQPLGEGTFACAVLADGKRCSNLVRITIRAAYDPAAEPVLRVSYLGTPVEQIGIWIVPPTPADPLLTNYVAAFPDLEFDGIWKSAPSVGTWDGEVGPLTPGKPYGITFWLRQYRDRTAAAATASSPTHLRARFVERPEDIGYDQEDKTAPLRSYVSEPIALASDPRDAAAFDQIFGLLPPSPLRN